MWTTACDLKRERELVGAVSPVNDETQRERERERERESERGRSIYVTAGNERYNKDKQTKTKRQHHWCRQWIAPVPVGDCVRFVPKTD